MNITFYKSCYDLAALSTCAKKNKDNAIWRDYADARIDITDNFFAIAKYRVSCSDYLSATEYEEHEFEINFIRDEKLVDTLRFKKIIDKKNIGSLANPTLSLEETLKAIKDYRPNFSEQFENIFKKTNLQKHEIDMIIEKAQMMFETLTKTEAQHQSKR